jgi:hypothetical protein
MTSEKRSAPAIGISRCPYCGSSNIVRNILVDQTADAGRIGLAYRVRFRVIIPEQLLTDLCDDCGSVVRTFVRTTGRKWVTDDT